MTILFNKVSVESVLRYHFIKFIPFLRFPRKHYCNTFSFTSYFFLKEDTYGVLKGFYFYYNLKMSNFKNIKCLFYYSTNCFYNEFKPFQYPDIRSLTMTRQCLENKTKRNIKHNIRFQRFIVLNLRLL